MSLSNELGKAAPEGVALGQTLLSPGRSPPQFFSPFLHCPFVQHQFSHLETFHASLIPSGTSGYLCPMKTERRVSGVKVSRVEREQEPGQPQSLFRLFQLHGSIQTELQAPQSPDGIPMHGHLQLLQQSLSLLKNFPVVRKLITRFLNTKQQGF